MTDKFEDSLGFKVFAYCPIPLVDVAAGLTVYACEAGVKMAGDSMAGYVKNAVAAAAAAAVDSAGASMDRQIEHVSRGVRDLSARIGDLAEAVGNLGKE